MLSDVTAVLFDLDGTLVNTVELILQAHDHTFARHLKGPWPTHRQIVRNFGRPLAQALLEYAEADGLPGPAGQVPGMVEVYRSFQNEHHDRLVSEYGGMRDTVRTLRDLGYTTGVVTSKLMAGARRELEQFGFVGLLDVMVFLEDTTRHKPEPEPLLEAARRGGFEPARAVYVGDSIHDIAAGRAAGTKTAGALWGPFERADLEAAGPDVLVEAPRDLLALLPGPAR